MFFKRKNPILFRYLLWNISIVLLLFLCLVIIDNEPFNEITVKNYDQLEPIGRVPDYQFTGTSQERVYDSTVHDIFYQIFTHMYFVNIIIAFLVESIPYFLEKQLNRSLEKACRTKFSDYYKVGLYSTPIVLIIQLLLMKIYNSH
jgi:hypothetical protein